MQKYRVKKDFPSRSTRVFREDEIIELPNSKHPRVRMLLDNGFIEKSCNYDFKVIAVSKLAKVEIADKNYTEGDKKRFTYDEALEIEKKLEDGWRLPTRKEWALICEEFACGSDGRLDSKLLMKRLNLVYAGYVNGSSLNDVGSWGYYWSRTASSANSAYTLYFYSSGVRPAGSGSRYVGFSVRMVRDIDFGKGNIA